MVRISRGPLQRTLRRPLRETPHDSNPHARSARAQDAVLSLAKALILNHYCDPTQRIILLRLLPSMILIPRCGAVPVHPSAACSALQDKHMSLRLIWDRPKSRGIGRTQHVVPSKNIYNYEHQRATTRAVYTLDRGRGLT